MSDPLLSPIPLGALLAVQPGAIVSRALLKKTAGTVTLFAFDAGEGLSEHSAPHEALVVGVEGEAAVTVSGAEMGVNAGDVLRLPAGAPHALVAKSPFKMLLVMLRDPAK